MSEVEKLAVYLEKLRVLSYENLQDKEISALQALKEALDYIEGEMTGY